MIKDIRLTFEKLAKSHFYSIERNEHGEYSNSATYNMWVGYWIAKVESKELVGEDAIWINAHK